MRDDPRKDRRPWLSLVIPTLGRTDELHACLASLAPCASEDLEVLVVDQNPDDRLDGILRHFSPLLRIVPLRQQTANASAARNRGARAARGIWIGFPDDDCKFLPSTLPGLRQRIGKADADLIVLRSVEDRGGPSGVRGYDREVQIDDKTLRNTIAESTIYLRRDLFLSVGGFDPAFGPGGLFPADEGIDLIRRLWLRHPGNLTMTYCPQIEIVHPQNLPYVDRASLKKAYRYAQGRGACFGRHWKTASKRRALTMVVKAFIAPIVFRGPRGRLGPVNLIGCLDGFLRYHAYSRKKSLR
jgi:glycosyltransferase involved in cell wall biosynthesis